MPNKTFKPMTSTQRLKTVADFSVLTKRKEKPKTPKALIAVRNRKAGRNAYGRITVRHRGGGHKRQYRLIDFKRDKFDILGKVVSIEYDPNRTAYIALINYADGDKRYILSPVLLKVGDSVISGNKTDIQPGNHLLLSEIPVGTLIHNIELLPGRGGKMARSAGGYAQLMAKDKGYCHIKLPSGEIRLVLGKCRASVGQLSNPDNENLKIGSAGRKRWFGIKPTVRGVAMNPVDHPMGGGEGRASGGHPRSPWGQAAKGLRTRRNKRTTPFIVKRRRK